MKKLFLRSLIALFLLAPTASFAGKNTVFDYFGGMPKLEAATSIEVPSIDTPLAVDPLIKQIDTLNNKLFEVSNAVWGGQYYDPRGEKMKEVQPKIDAIMAQFITPAYDAAYLNDKKTVSKLLTKGEKSVDTLLTETKKWSTEQNKKDVFKQLEDSKTFAEMARAETSLLIEHFSGDFSAAEKAKAVRVEKLADYYSKRFSEEYKKAKVKLMIAKEGEDLYSMIYPVQSFQWRFESLFTRLEDIILSK